MKGCSLACVALLLQVALVSCYVIVPKLGRMPRECVVGPVPSDAKLVETPSSLAIHFANGTVRRLNRCKNRPRQRHGEAWRAWAQFQQPRQGLSLLSNQWTALPITTRMQQQSSQFLT